MGNLIFGFWWCSHMRPDFRVQKERFVGVITLYGVESAGLELFCKIQILHSFLFFRQIREYGGEFKIRNNKSKHSLKVKKVTHILFVGQLPATLRHPSTTVTTTTILPFGQLPCLGQLAFSSLLFLGLYLFRQFFALTSTFH